MHMEHRQCVDQYVVTGETPRVGQRHSIAEEIAVGYADPLRRAGGARGIKQRCLVITPVFMRTLQDSGLTADISEAALATRIQRQLKLKLRTRRG